MGHRAQAVARYNEHIEDVKATVPADKLLVFSVDQGWEPLCKFFGVPVPDKPFPRLNDRETFQKNIANMMRASYAILAGLAVVCAGLIYGVWRIVG
jgi:hypothetical protein